MARRQNIRKGAGIDYSNLMTATGFAGRSDLDVLRSLPP